MTSKLREPYSQYIFIKENVFNCNLHQCNIRVRSECFCKTQHARKLTKNTSNKTASHSFHDLYENQHEFI